MTEALLELENVVLAPHLGSATRDTRVAMGMLCVSALARRAAPGPHAAERRGVPTLSGLRRSIETSRRLGCSR